MDKPILLGNRIVIDKEPKTLKSKAIYLNGETKNPNLSIGKIVAFGNTVTEEQKKEVKDKIVIWESYTELQENLGNTFNAKNPVIIMIGNILAISDKMIEL